MLKIIRENPRLIIFGLVTAFFSGPGQSYLVSFFIPGMQADLHINSARFGDLYFIATLGGGLALPFIGKLLDRAELLRFTLFMGFCLAMGCLVLSISESLVFVTLGLLFIRCFGQGAMKVISSTTIARNFGSQRGRALGITNQGFPIAEATLPLIMSTWIATYGWRSGWSFLAILILLTFIPSVIYLLNHPSIPRQTKAAKKNGSKSGSNQHLLDFRFYIAILNSLTTPAVLTALFLFQVHIAGMKSWSVQIMAEAFVFYAAARSLATLLSGPVVDRFGATNLLGFLYLPLIAAISCLLLGKNELFAFAYLSFAGITIGSGVSIKTAFWAEAYGTKHLGSVRGSVSLVSVLATALAPPIFGRALENGFSLNNILNFMLLFSCFGSLIGFLTTYIYRKKQKTLVEV